MTKYTKDQIELKSYIEKMNSDTQFKTTTDLNHWADYGIFNVTDYEKYMITCDIKELSGTCGSKVRLDFNEYSLEKLLEMREGWVGLAIEAERQKELAKKQKANEFVKRIKDTCKLGAKTYKNALRWILDAEGYMEDDMCLNDAGYLCYLFGLDYRFEKVFLHILDIKCPIKWNNGKAYI